MILAFLAFTLVYASCDPINLAAERMTICTRIENITLMDLSGLLSSLEKFTIDLAEKQANGTALKDSTAIKFAVNAVDNGNDTITQMDLRAASWNMTCNMSSFSFLHSTRSDIPHYYHYLQIITLPLQESPRLVADRYLGPSANTTPSIISTTTSTITYSLGLYVAIYLIILTAQILTAIAAGATNWYWKPRAMMKHYIRRQAWRMIYYIRTNDIANAVCMFLWVVILCGVGVFLGMRPEQVELAHQWKGDELPFWHGGTLELLIYLFVILMMVFKQFERHVIGTPYRRSSRAKNQATRQLKRRIRSGECRNRLRRLRELLEEH